MTRINLINPTYLTNRHLAAEYLEIRHIPASLNRSLNSSNFSNKKIPKKFTLNKGHVSFFYDKGQYIHMRFVWLQNEMLNRKFNLSIDKMILNCDIFDKNNYYNNWQPSEEDIKLVCNRIKEKILLKPHLYPDKDRFLDYYDKLS